jgi:adhesin/invasin
VKTISLKKVSAVAVASLGFGLLSVVPAFAQAPVYTTVLGTVTPASPVVGSVVTIPLGITIAANTESAASTQTFTATFAHKPINTASTLVADVVGTAFATAGADKAVASAATNVISLVTPASDIAVVTNGLAGNFTFTPDTAGRYSVTIAGGGTSSATTAIVINVGGAALTQATSGKGLATGTANVGGSAVVAYALAAPTAAASVISVTTSGVGGISNAIGCADQSTVLEGSATAVRCSGSAVGTIATSNGLNYSDGFRYTSAATITSGALTGSSKSEMFTFDAGSNVAGTQTITVTGITLATGAPTTLATVTITWGATPVVSPALSTSFACPGAVASCSADATVLAAKTAQTSAANRAASIFVTVRNSAGTDLTSASTITATVTGPGTIGIHGTIGSATSAGRALTGTAGQNTIAVYGDGTEGKSTITISVGTTVIATETVNFYGAVASVTVTQNLSNPLANGFLLGSANATSGTTMTAAGSWANASGNVPAVVLALKDASGNLVPNQAANISATSSDATVMSATITAVEDTTAAVGAGYYNVSVSSAAGSAAGKSATLTFRVLLTGTTYVSAPATTFTIGSSKISKVAITVDKTAYTAGDPAVMTVTATDAAGLAVADGLYASSTKTAPLFSKSVVAISTLPTTSTLTTVGGKKTYKFYAPSVPGSFTVTGEYYDNDAAVVSTTATSSVTDANAGLITQIDALNAKIVALNALIAKIMKKLGVK